jgi:hypothetical protein
MAKRKINVFTNYDHHYYFAYKVLKVKLLKYINL